MSSLDATDYIVRWRSDGKRKKASFPNAQLARDWFEEKLKEGKRPTLIARSIRHERIGTDE